MGQINLNNFKVITDKLNTFFVDNKFMVASEIPTEGEFKVGDIIINNGPTNVDEPMWICVEAGNPGTWTVFNSGSGGKLTTARNRVVLDGESKSEVSIGVSGFNKASGVLMVFINSRFMTEGVDYEINDDSTKIVAIEGAWNEELSSEFEIEMVVFKMMGEEGVVSSVNEIVKLKNTVVVNEAVNEVEIGIDGFNEGDDLTVYRNSVYMIEGIDYEVQGSKIVSLKGAWNAEGGSDYKFTFEVLKTVAKVNPDAVVGMEHLTEDVKEAIEAAGNIDLSGKQDKSDEGLVTTDKTIVGAINELFQSANNGKELIASAIGEPLSSEDTFSAMSTDINSLLSTFKTNMMNNGVTVESSDRFKSLIDKIATMVEEGEGKGIQYAEGESNITVLKNNSFTLSEYEGINNLKFTPSVVFVALKSFIANIGTATYTFNNAEVTINSIDHTTENSLSRYLTMGTYSTTMKFALSVIDNGFNIFIQSPHTYQVDVPYVWYAIGVGEEDTTLRDSLASILQEEGVSVTEEDDMASLIIKVDEEFENKNTEIENTRSILAGLMQEGGYDITGDEDIDSLLDLLVLSGINVIDIKQIACGYSHTIILKYDGSIWSCGNNGYGQLGLGNTTDQSTFTQVTTNIDNDVKQIDCGYYHTIILKNDGSVWSCGYNTYGQLGLNSTTNYTSFTQVTTNINNDVKQISCGYQHTFILKNDGSVWSCGINSSGQLGLGTSGSDTYQTTFTQVTTNINNDVEEVICAGTGNHTFIIKNDGSVWSCGKNNYGQLGLNDTTDRTTFTQVTTNINNDVEQISCGGGHTFIIKNDGSVWGSGYNTYGGLGLDDTTNRTSFTQVTYNINNDVKQIACGAYHTVILKNDGSVYSCGYNRYGRLGLGDTTDRTTFTQVTTNINNDVKEVVCGTYHTFILKNDGSVWGCGNNSNGQLGLGDTSTSNTTFIMIPRGLY